MLGKLVIIFLGVCTMMLDECRVIHKHQRVGGGVREVAGGGWLAVHIIHRA